MPTLSVSHTKIHETYIQRISRGNHFCSVTSSTENNDLFKLGGIGKICNFPLRVYKMINFNSANRD